MKIYYIKIYYREILRFVEYATVRFTASNIFLKIMFCIIVTIITLKLLVLFLI